MGSKDPSTVVAASSSPAARDTATRSRLALTILWHRDFRRVGECEALPRSAEIRVSRKTPPFDTETDVVLSSREPFLTIIDRGGPIELRPCPSKTKVVVNGRPLDGPRAFGDAEVRSGLVLLLADELVTCLQRAEQPRLRGPAFGMIGGSDAAEAVRRQIAQVADQDTSVLIRGETGAGKELVALAIREASKRAAGPFVTISLADVPAQTAAAELFGYERGAFTGAAQSHPGLFAQADGGTLLIDEVALGLPDVLNMLLRVLETREIRPLGSGRGRKVDVRVITATDEKLEAAVREGRFARALFYRLAKFQIEVPPLRERREDVGPLLLHFLRTELAAVGQGERLEPRPLGERAWLKAADVARIALNAFPGNVRMLQDLAHQIVISNRGEVDARLDSRADQMLAEGEAPPEGDAMPSTSPRPSKVTDDQIEAALASHNYNYSAAAAALGVSRNTLYERVRANPRGVRKAADLSDTEILDCHARHRGDVAAMAAELRVSPKPLAARVARARVRLRR
jgi:two-component system, NtrC family, nitrogen regulation response regulator GlnG